MSTVPNPARVYPATIVNVHDGDTFTLNLDLGFRVGVVINARVRGVNSPELNTAEGKAAQKYASDLLPVGARVTVQSYRDRRSFARWVCDVWTDTGVSVADLLISTGNGKPTDDQGNVV